MKPENYFDHAATTFLLPEARDAMLPWLSCANANSLHSLGRDAQTIVEECREQCAIALGAEDSSQIFFTSGATEGNNWIAYQYRDSLAISPFEHSSMREPALHFGATVLENDGYLLQESPSSILQSVLLVNNETGAILAPPGSTPTHSDLTQAIGKVAFDLEPLAFATLSAHKFGGPKGVGLLYAREPYALSPFHFGGEHEFGLRAGTLNVAGIVGMTVALQSAISEQPANHAKAERASKLLFDVLGREHTIAPQSPFIQSLGYPDFQGETLVIELDALGFGLSSGAACSSRTNEPSHVLVALGVPESEIRGTIRISFGASNTEDSVVSLGQAILQLTNMR